MTKLLHVADLHLDSPFSGMSLASAESMREEQRAVFTKIIAYANENEVDLLLIAGDLFDAKYITTRTKKLVVDSFAALKCPVVIAPGNHDPYTAIPLYRSAELGENVYVFSSEEMQVFDFDHIGVSICGYAFMNERLDRSPVSDFSMAAEALRAKKDNLVVLCAHADIQSPISKYAPVSIFDIERCSFDYAALGHIHIPISTDSDKALIRYSGFALGRAFDELGDGGGYLVTFEDGKETAIEKVVFSSSRFLWEKLDISGAVDINDIKSMIQKHIHDSEYGKETSLRIELIGTLPLTCILNTDALEEERGALRELSIKNSTIPEPDSLSLKNDPTLRGELYRVLLPKLNSDDADERRRAADALNLGLFAIEGMRLADILADDISGGAK